MKKILEEYTNADSREEKEKLLEKEYTRRNIAKATGININTLKNYLDKSQGTSKSLEEHGLIDKIKFDSNNSSSPLIYYKIKKDGNSYNGKDSSYVCCQIEKDNPFDNLNFKLKVLYSLFILSNISINKEGLGYLKSYCENYAEEINVQEYDSYYRFINKAVKGFDFKKYSIDINKAKYTDLSYVKDIGNELKNSKILIPSPDKTFLHNPQKIMENTAFTKKSMKKGVKSHLTSNIGHLQNIELTHNIGLCLKNHDLSAKELTDEIYRNYNKDNISIDFLAISIGNCVNNLINCQLISEETIEDEIHYKLSDSFKKLLEEV